MQREQDSPSSRNSQLELNNKNQGPEEDLRSKIVEKNVKLKLEIHELSNELEKMLIKDKQRKQKFQALDESSNHSQNLVKEKATLLKQQKLQITELKNKIFRIKRQLESVYGNRNVIKKEEELKALKQEIVKLENQKSSLEKMKQSREGELEAMANQDRQSEKLQELKQELALVKEQSRLVNEKVVESERILRKNHEQFIKKQEKVKELEARVASFKEKSKSRRPIQTVTPEMIIKLEEQISCLQQERREREKEWEEKIKLINMELQEKQVQEQKKLLILKEKQREFKVNELKIKELRKLVRCNLAERRSTEENRDLKDLDMSQFRHKRNIKYLK